MAGGAVLGAAVGYQVILDLRLRRRGVVEIRLSPADRPSRLTLSYADGRTSTHSVRELGRVDVSRDDILAPYVTLALHLPGRVVRTAAGSDVMPTRLIDALVAADVEVRTSGGRDWRPVA